LAGVGRTTRVLDAATGKVAGSSNLEVFALGPDGRHLALAENDIRIHAFVPPGDLVRTLPGHKLGTAAVAWSPDGRHLVSRGGEGAIKLWDAATGFEILDLPLAKAAGQPVWSPDGRRLALHPSWSGPN